MKGYHDKHKYNMEINKGDGYDEHKEIDKHGNKQRGWMT